MKNQKSSLGKLHQPRTNIFPAQLCTKNSVVPVEVVMVSVEEVNNYFFTQNQRI